MKYLSCDLIEHGLDFAQKSINFCCRTTKEGGGYKKLIDNYNGELLDLEKFFKLKREYRNKMKSGEGIPECKNCIYLEEKDYDDEDYISSINFNHGLKCNAKCIYCGLTYVEETCFEYDVYPIMKQLSDNGYLKQGGQITVAGGEPTLYHNFDKLIKLFIDNKLSPVRVLTNGIKYSEIITEGLQKDIVNIMISVDSGTPEMYKKIKGVDAFEKVWNNIARYLNAQKYDNLVKTKYIIIPDVNDTKDEIIKYFEKSQSVGIGCVAFDIEMEWYNVNKDNIPEYLLDLVDFTVQEAKNRNLNYEPIDRVVYLLKEIKKKKDIHISFRGHEL